MTIFWSDTFETMQSDAQLLHFWVISLYWIQAEIWKKEDMYYVRAFSLSTSFFLLSIPVENSEAIWKKSYKMQQLLVFIWYSMKFMLILVIHLLGEFRQEPFFFFRKLLSFLKVNVRRKKSENRCKSMSQDYKEGPL